MATQYTLRVSNESQLAGSICVYQTFDEQKTFNNLFSLAWFSKGCNPNTQVKFRWTIEYGFSWNESGVLVPGVTFDASQLLAADPSKLGSNATGLTRTENGYHFSNAPKEVPLGSLGIFSDHTVPANRAAVGIAMGGSPAVAVQAGPNLSFVFKPHPTYWVCFGKYVEGEVIDINMMTDAQKIVFGPNEYSMHATLQADNTWKTETATDRNLAISERNRAISGRNKLYTAPV